MGTIVVGAVVLVVAVLAARKIYRDKKNGNCCSGCGGNCTAHQGRCHTKS